MCRKVMLQNHIHTPQFTFGLFPSSLSHTLRLDYRSRWRWHWNHCYVFRFYSCIYLWILFGFCFGFGSKELLLSFSILRIWFVCVFFWFASNYYYSTQYTYIYTMFIIHKHTNTNRSWQGKKKQTVSNLLLHKI